MPTEQRPDECFHQHCTETVADDHYLCRSCQPLTEIDGYPKCPSCDSTPRPGRTEFCDHLQCEAETPGNPQRICSKCITLIDPDTPSTCPQCGAGL